MRADPHPLKEGDRVEVDFRGFSKPMKKVWATILEVRPNMDIAWTYRVHYDTPESGMKIRGGLGTSRFALSPSWNSLRTPQGRTAT